MSARRYEAVVIGTGCAGYATALRLWQQGVRNIAILTEGRLMGTSRNTGSDKQTYYKLSLCGDEGDSVREMAETLYGGGGVMGEHALCEAAYSARCFLFLVELGVPFPTNAYGEYAGYKTDHDPRSRATSCGPLTSRYMTEALERAVTERGIEILDGLLAVEITKDETGVTGVIAIDVSDGTPSVLETPNVVLCTGGPAGIYENSVYPESQHGATALAIRAGARLSNMEEWQYGIASRGFRWNLSGTYQQVLPCYISVDADGTEREFLADALGTAALGPVFLKGYQWPFDTRKLTGSSQVDLLVAREIKCGRRVYLDFTRNPRGLEQGFRVLPEEAYDYLERSGALFGTPVERLHHMNPDAIALYAAHGIDLWHERPEIAVSAQHCNGGVAVDAHWQSDVTGLYAVGEAAGTFGVYRPGGSALNSTQVGALRAAEHIAAQKRKIRPVLGVNLPKVRFGTSNIAKIDRELRHDMSTVADFDRKTEGMRRLYERLGRLAEDFFAVAVAKDAGELAALYRLYDAVLTARAVLSAMLCAARELGSHGGALVDGLPPREGQTLRNSRTLTAGGDSKTAPVSPLPRPELWFETLLAEQQRKFKKKEGSPI